MAQLVKCLSCKCDDLTLYSQHSPSMEGAGRESGQHVLVISTLARQRQKDSGACWPISLVKLVAAGSI